MTQKINNPYEKLLDYLKAQEQPKKKSPAKEVIPKKVKKVEISETKKLIEESKIYGYIPGESFENPPPKKSEGFDVSKLESMMRAKLIEEHKKSQSYERPYISVGELCSCIRQCFYIRMKYPFDIKNLYTFSYLYLMQKVGNVIHDVIQELYGFSEVEKTILSEKYKVKGRLDGVRDKFIFEIKSLDADKFKNQYVKEHYLQAIIYAYILNTEYNYNIETITIIYVMRNLRRIVPFDLPISDKLAESLLSKAPILKAALDTHQVPDPFGATNDTCKYCLYQKQCSEDKCNEILQPFKKKQKAIVKQHGCRNVMEKFAAYFELLNSGALAGPLKEEYDQLRAEIPELPSVRTKDEKTAALTEATRAINQLNFKGDKTDSTQYLEFPRGGDTTIPATITNACYEIAWKLLTGVDVDYEMELLRHSGISYEGIRETYHRGVVPEWLASGIVSARAWLLLRPYLRDPKVLTFTRES